MELLDNQKVIGAVEATNGEQNPDGTAEKAPIFEPQWTADPGVKVEVSEDGITATVTADDIAAGGPPVSGTITLKAKSKADLAEADLIATETFVVSNPAANSLKITFGAPQPK